MRNSLKWFKTKPQDIRILCYKKVVGIIKYQDGTERIKTEWRQCQNDLEIGSFNKPNKDILEIGYFTKDEIKAIQKEE